MVSRLFETFSSRAISSSNARLLTLKSVERVVLLTALPLTQLNYVGIKRSIAFDFSIFSMPFEKVLFRNKVISFFVCIG